ncbi:heme-binding protein [Roseivirga pacifica]|uniref:heme-binding protein n=1 Tax=Roseivirga pacifica TaxID=1267423 RepID=UPI0020955BD9|nr:heme-binding protein [Roseivirga pacifica]MCO6360490.1 hypothetical protein [Roseivirga pacifica]MCO6368379.1 hypothetical protein [Roseivirga pacifica]MCO6372521.1 hypothetical protein [Roseivirga pacifica]MCO6376579.1 hypothetical protein [Roseivirga pacifica]MCO6378141.1 hypothetical protein [Roseivirga pacifica]
MATFKVQDFSRLGGSSIKELANDFTEKLAKQEGAKQLTTAELTTEVWDKLQGTWVGNKGWNLISVPAMGSKPDGAGDFKLLIQPYIETMTFTDAGAHARNRGGNADQFVAALEYHQRVTDQKTGELLHVENGMFMNLSEIVDNDGKELPLPQFNIARSGTIPHGDSIMLLGRPPVVTEGRIDFPEASTIPTDFGPGFGYTDVFTHPSMEGNLFKSDPNKTLSADLDEMEKNGFKVKKTTTFIFDSDNSGGIHNIPFIVKHANAVRMQAFFWLEEVENTNTGQVFDQLQYTQIIDLDFQHPLGKDGKPDQSKLIKWPHVTINTMVKQ